MSWDINCGDTTDLEQFNGLENTDKNRTKAEPKPTRKVTRKATRKATRIRRVPQYSIFNPTIREYALSDFFCHHKKDDCVNEFARE